MRSLSIAAAVQLSLYPPEETVRDAAVWSRLAEVDRVEALSLLAELIARGAAGLVTPSGDDAAMAPMVLDGNRRERGDGAGQAR